VRKILDVWGQHPSHTFIADPLFNLLEWVEGGRRRRSGGS
jgi:hypothetical protein